MHLRVGLQEEDAGGLTASLAVGFRGCSRAGLKSLNQGGLRIVFFPSFGWSFLHQRRSSQRLFAASRLV